MIILLTIKPLILMAPLVLVFFTPSGIFKYNKCQSVHTANMRIFLKFVTKNKQQQKKAIKGNV